MNLWGEEFVVESTPEKAKKLLDKINNPKQIKKKPKSNGVNIEERLISIQENVIKILGKYADSTITIKSIEEYQDYIEKCNAPTMPLAGILTEFWPYPICFALKNNV